MVVYLVHSISHVELVELVASHPQRILPLVGAHVGQRCHVEVSHNHGCVERAPLCVGGVSVGLLAVVAVRSHVDCARVGGAFEV